MFDRQPTLKPQDVVVACKIAVCAPARFTYARLASELSLVPSQIHASIKALHLSGLVYSDSAGDVTHDPSMIRELLVTAVPIVFPAVIQGSTRGDRTAEAVAAGYDPVQPRDQLLVWPAVDGSSKGAALLPLHQCLPQACRADAALYRLFSAVDAVRVGNARERLVAKIVINELIA